MVKISASFDDGSIYDLRVADMMYRFNIPTTFYIPVNWQKYNLSKNIEPLSDDQLKMIVNEPLFELGSHGVNHELLTKVLDEVQDYEIEESKKEFERIFEQKIEKFCYPRGYNTKKIRDKVKKAGYKSARTVEVGNLDGGDDPYKTPTTIHVGYDRKEYGGQDWLTFSRNMIMQASALEISGKEVVFSFFGHSEEVNRYNQWDRLEQFLEEVKRYLM